MQPASRMSGQAKIGRYDLLSAIGQTAMGDIYKATDQTGHTVALQTFELDRAAEGRAEFAARFYREANDARLSHPNIVAIREVGEADGIAYIATDYPEGESLRALLDSGAMLPIGRAVEIAADVANALNHAHENRVMHGDIKPENIVIGPAGDAKIMNFGIAQTPAWPPQAGPAAGPAGYLSPEQVAGGNADVRADIFALGAVLYEMLTGVAPFEADDPGAVADNILKDLPVPPSTRDPRVPPVFDRIIGRALAKRPRDRYQTGVAFARDLQEAGGPASVEGAAPPRSTGSPRAARYGLVGIPPSPPQSPPPDLKPLLLALPIVLMAVWVMYPQAPQPSAELAATAPQPATAPATAPAEQAAALAEPTAPVQPPDLMPPVEPAISEVLPHTETVPPNIPAPVPAPPAKATLALAVSPWGEVYVNGESVGVSPPLTALQLDAGRHRLEIRNDALEPYRRTVNLEPGKPLKIKHKFR